jgi:hypothetical protein
MGFDGPMSLAVHVKDVESLAERVPFDRPDIRLDVRWHGARARDFLKAARQFVADTKFIEFLNSQKALYEAINARARAFVEQADLEWFHRFFGPHPGVRLIVVPGMANGGPSYGPSFIGEDGIEEFYAIPGVWEVDSEGLPKLGTDWRDTLVHEFIHSYSNPIVDKFAAQMDGAARQINDLVSDAMRRQGYGASKTLLYESLVRSSTIEYVLEHDGSTDARRLIQQENANSFFWISDLCNLLGQYKKERVKYPTLESFMPGVVQFFNDVAPRVGDLAKRYEDSRPKVVWMSVADGATDVDPALTEIRVRFSRAMSDANLNKDPRFGKPSFDETCTVLTIPIALEPEHDYEFWLRWPDRQPFSSGDGVPLQPVLVRFRTKGPSARR